MKERPIIFSDKMVKAILQGSKTQTRRVVKVETGQPRGVVPAYMEPYLFDGIQEEDDQGRKLWVGTHPDFPTDAGKWFSCAYGAVGDRLWVRETWLYVGPGSGSDLPEYEEERNNAANHKSENCWYRAGDVPGGLKWTSPIFMPRWVSRITLEITDIRVERLQDISEEDAKAEGVAQNWTGNTPIPPEYENEYEDYRATSKGDYEGFPCFSARESFESLWDVINGKRDNGVYAWEQNPWVWVIDFKVVQGTGSTLL